MIHHVVNHKLLISVAPRAGTHTILDVMQNIPNYEEVVRSRVPTNNVVNGKFRKVKFVRNPYTRAVSSYYIFVNNTRMEIYKEVGMDRQEAAQTSFLQFLRIMSHIDMEHTNIHVRNQETYHDGGFLEYDEVRKIEDIKWGINDVLKYADVCVDPEALKNGNVRGKTLYGGKVFDLSMGDMRRTEHWPVVPEYHEFYNDETADLVARIYSGDLYDYQVPSEQSDANDNYALRV